ncbi:MAG: His/Gly/Thr/Pro-type tRNA ligase C-terminal domain-containing protein [Bradyrhizobium sp.]|uniref:His/Gly/Thr/Pro-type tRNA ligase C-terminal domain-containing protein n=1 Tax=Bradyrhizobium sp. TaxID=376 RepID=UPI00391DB6AF
MDLRNEKINYKVREHSLAKIPALLVVGKKEAETHSVSASFLPTTSRAGILASECSRTL